MSNRQYHEESRKHTVAQRTVRVRVESGIAAVAFFLRPVRPNGTCVRECQKFRRNNPSAVYLIRRQCVERIADPIIRQRLRYHVVTFDLLEPPQAPLGDDFLRQGHVPQRLEYLLVLPRIELFPVVRERTDVS